MDNCLFCKIIDKKIPAHIVYEDELFLSFLDINPQSPGHVQVIPKKHYRFVWDVPDCNKPSPNFCDFMIVVRTIARALRETFGTNVVWSKVMGDEVPHAHVWLFPNPYEATGDKKDFEENTKKIKIKLVRV